MGIYSQAGRHRDSDNQGPSVIKALGEFTGGRLWVWPNDSGTGPVQDLPWSEAVLHDPREWVDFNGLQAHETENFEGTRYSLVFYTSSGIKNANQQTLQILRELGANFVVA